MASGSGKSVRASSLDVALGLDIGGTKIAAGIVTSGGQIVGTNRIVAPNTNNAEKYFDAVLQCAYGALRKINLPHDELIGIGCGCGGPMYWPMGIVSPINIQAWREFPLRERLEREFRKRPVFVHNDAVALAVGEHWQGSAKGATSMIAVTVSTGIGAGLILNNKIFHGKSGQAGHIGHIVVDRREGADCKCGGSGCLEAIASGPSAVRWATSHGWTPRLDESADGASLARSARVGDEVAIRSLARAGRAVGTALADCANLLDLKVAVVAGGFSQSGAVFWDPLRDAFHSHSSLRFARDMQIIPSQFLHDAGIMGSAAFALMPSQYGWTTSTGNAM